MFKDNLIQLRKMKSYTQEDLAEKLDVTRQAIAKWESGETVPDITKCVQLAEIFEVSLDDLVNYTPQQHMGLNLPPKGKHLFGLVTVGDKGQIVIPATARSIFNISSGDELLVLGDEDQGLALVNPKKILALADGIRKKQN